MTKMSTPDASPFALELLNAIPSLNARARSLCRGQPDAQDLVQETIARALSHMHQFEPGTNLRAWLQKILFHLFVSRRRRSLRERSSLAQFVAVNEYPPFGDVTAMGTEIVSPRLLAALEALPGKIATIVRRVDIDELSYREVAEEMNIPIGTVMSRLSRGRRRLAQAVADDTLRVRAQAA
jgi:RNA polymerase sigma-70 factor, ECF subfamily